MHAYSISCESDAVCNDMPLTYNECLMEPSFKFVVFDVNLLLSKFINLFDWYHSKLTAELSSDKMQSILNGVSGSTDFGLLIVISGNLYCILSFSARIWRNECDSAVPIWFSAWHEMSRLFGDWLASEPLDSWVHYTRKWHFLLLKSLHCAVLDVLFWAQIHLLIKIKI